MEAVNSYVSWKRLPAELVKRHGHFGGGFIEIWYTEHTLQNHLKINYSGPQDAIQVELGGGAIYQNIAKDKFGGSLDFFAKNRSKLRPIGGHDIDVLVINQKTLEKVLKEVGYAPHSDQNKKFWYRKQKNPYTNKWEGISNKRTKQLFKKQAANHRFIQYDLFKDMKIADMDMTGCDKKLREIKAYGITKWNLCNEDLIATKSIIVSRYGFIPMQGPKIDYREKSLRPRDFVDIANLVAATEPERFDYTYFVDRLEMNMQNGGKSSKKRKVGQVDSSIPYNDRSVDQKVITLLSTIRNQTDNNNLETWIDDRLLISRLSKNSIKGLVFDWSKIENNFSDIVPKIIDECKVRW